MQRKLEEKNKSLSSSTTSSSWRNVDKSSKEDPKLFGSVRDKERGSGAGFGRTRDDGPPPERRSIFSRGNDERKTFGSRDNDRGGWSRGGAATSGGVFDKGFKDGGPREGGRSAFDRDTPRKREIPSSNEQVINNSK